MIHLNPGDSGTFPWLSGMAQNYEHYRFKAIRIVYDSCATVLTNGRIVISPDFDAGNSLLTENLASTTQLISRPGAKHETVSKSFSIPFQWQGLRELRNVRAKHAISAALPELRQQDAGRFYILVEGVITDEILGDLWIDYEFELITPSMRPKPGKYYEHGQVTASGSSSGTVYGPFGDTSTTYTNEPHYHNTLGIQHKRLFGTTRGAYNAAPTRYKFDEDFTGQMLIHSGPNSGTEPQGTYDVNPSDHNIPSDTPLATTTLIQDGYDALAGAMAIYKVVAKRGDFLYLFYDTAATFTTTNVRVAFSELATSALALL